MCALINPEQFPAISRLVELIDKYLVERHSGFFSENAGHPCLPPKRSKVIHDSLWGTNRFSWQELALIDSPVLQRLRFIHQVGLACQVYPSAHHTRFEHSLGVATVASKIFDSLLSRDRGKIRDIVRASTPDAGTDAEVETAIAQLRLELRLAAILHDTGHSLFSHSSEQVFERLEPIEQASGEISSIVGKQKGAGEAIAFAIATSSSVRRLLDRAGSSLVGEAATNDYNGPINLDNVALLIVGRARHPYLQFLGDIISSGFDADKLDYLLRDATCAGLPLRYDFERYFYAVRLEQNVLADGRDQLLNLYNRTCAKVIERRPPTGSVSYPHFETYRLRLPAKAMNTIEQIVICKLMLFSYIYHHPKVRAAEGTLVRLLNGLVDHWRENGEADDKILERFLDATDSSLIPSGPLLTGINSPLKEDAEETIYRLVNRLLPRELYRIGGAIAKGEERALLSDFLTTIQDKSQRAKKIAELETQIGEEILRLQKGLADSASLAIQKCGIRVDVPKPPKFEDVDELVIKGTHGDADMQLMQVFPIGEWTHAYTHFRYYVRIFCFSEYLEISKQAAKAAMKRVIRIESEDFYQKILRERN